jgi:hypothetical protein
MKYRVFYAIAAAVLMLGGQVATAQVILPHTFGNGDPADGDQVMENFQALENALLVTKVLDGMVFPPAGVSIRPAESALGAEVTVNADTKLVSIAVLNELTSAGNLKFLVFDHADHTTPVYVSAPQAFAADAPGVPTVKQSRPMSVILQGGHTYDIGAIADVAGNWQFGQADNTGNLINVQSNSNFSDYNNPVAGGHGGIFGPVRLYGLTNGTF